MKIYSEFEKLKKRFQLPKLNLQFDRSLYDLGFSAYYNWYYSHILLPDRRMGRNRMLAVLHEFCHAIQFRENRMVMDRRCTRQMYLQEFEAELFAIEQYEKIYAETMGSCMKDEWTLASYSEYLIAYKQTPAIYNTNR